MCLAIFKPSNNKIPKSHLKKGYDSNPHSMGMMWAHEGVLHVHKQMEDIDSFIEKYMEIEALDVPVAVHFRLATHGKKDLDNCHPFLVHDKLGLVHNGVFHGLGTKDKSDTWEFAELLAAVGVDTIFDNTMLQVLVERACGYGNKVILLNNEGKHFIAHSNTGAFINGVWYSNTYSINTPFYSKKKNKKGRVVVSSVTDEVDDVYEGYPRIRWVPMEDIYEKGLLFI